MKGEIQPYPSNSFATFCIKTQLSPSAVIAACENAILWENLLHAKYLKKELEINIKMEETEHEHEQAQAQEIAPRERISIEMRDLMRS